MWRSLKLIFTERPDLLFFGVFLWLIPFSWRNVILNLSPFPYTDFNEYMDISFFLGDVFLLLAILIYILNNKNYKLSILSNFKAKINTLFHVEHYSYIFPLVLFVVYALISLIWSDQRLLNLQFSYRLLVLSALFFYLHSIFVPRGTKEECSTWNILKFILSIFVFSGLIQACIGIGQFITGTSIGLFLFGESILSTALPGVAKVVLGESVHLRACGTFLHPNIYAGYLFISFFSLIYIYRSKLFHVEHILYVIMLLTLGVGILLSFSKSTIFAFIIASIFIFSLKKEKMFHVEQYISVILIIMAVFLNIYLQNEKYLYQSIQERTSLIPVTLEMLQESPIIGHGGGQFVYKLAFYDHFQSWQLQSFHNIYVLILLELGIIGVLLFLIFLYKLIANVPRGTIFGTYIVSITIGLLSIGIFDHYLWDIEAGQYMFWTVLGLVASSRYLTK